LFREKPVDEGALGAEDTGAGAADPRAVRPEPEDPEPEVPDPEDTDPEAPLPEAPDLEVPVPVVDVAPDAALDAGAPGGTGRAEVSASHGVSEVSWDGSSVGAPGSR
jgi:hypothetical protein